jgi:hypothetical protein
MIGIRLCAAALTLLFAVSAGAEEQDGLVKFTDVSPYSATAEILRRMGTPPDYQEVVDRLAAQGQRLADQPIDPKQEEFWLHVPEKMPAGGYNLLVWVWPFEKAPLPRGWGRALDKHGMILVAAQHSGNPERIESRRAPLALIGAANVMSRYQINPDHIYIGGLSGGSRVSERLALAYPDLFRGAILNASSDTLESLTMPPADLLDRFLETSHLVLITGDLDLINLGIDTAAMNSFREHCMFRFEYNKVPYLNHAVLPPEAFEQALRAILDPPPIDNMKLNECRAKKAAH